MRTLADDLHSVQLLLRGGGQEAPLWGELPSLSNNEKVAAVSKMWPVHVAPDFAGIVRPRRFFFFTFYFGATLGTMTSGTQNLGGGGGVQIHDS